MNLECPNVIDGMPVIVKSGEYYAVTPTGDHLQVSLIPRLERQQFLAVQDQNFTRGKNG